MADINRLSRVQGGVRNVDLQQNTLVVGSLKVGAASPTEFTKALLDSLINVEDAFTNGTLQASGSNVTIAHEGVNYSEAGTSLEQHLAAIDSALATSGLTDFETDVFRISDATDSSKKIAVNASAITASTTRTITMPDANVDLGSIASNVADIADLVSLSGVAINSTDLGTFTGNIITDNVTVKGALQELETAIEAIPDPVFYAGTYDATSNSPDLTDVQFQVAGALYKVTTAGTQDLGTGNITFNVGDKVVYNGVESQWDKWDVTDEVTSVNGETGDVVLDTDDIDEGITNLYFTDVRAREAKIEGYPGTSTGPIQNGDSILQALEKLEDNASGRATVALDNLDNTAVNADIIPDNNATYNLGSAAINFLDVHANAVRSNADLTLSCGSAEQILVENKVEFTGFENVGFRAQAGEALGTGVRALRWAVGSYSETEGGLRLADNDATTEEKYNVVGLALAAAQEIGDSIRYIKSGPMIATAHGLTPGVPIYLGAAGVATNTAPTADDIAVIRLGVAIDADTIDVQIQVVGIN